ncbi:hypothetical protein ND861_10330 [Leptospira sp. 2 VSF19]|uniref:DUF218 domain-containing protein n=1 Tax=Leptospira soteropolitanensis TaxID=2950025 RepID=A0AAW5VDP8_9LEPT|nr:hypothetical protein [Leptospira soteropolitanensis]MCW7493300.1 hypothetical protein [Leptospira soteropolitanensis]MCW7500631.1 hypothetical protein [Leptospira soteropolitanensis]MCW7523150.1 hypothetical protein [Leptospira soteropolitanensis]MCW7526743.1 hypothetical protein [Leptospira soteropolitanensis]MCW7530868.1 hypothetical protein [Leptospira soteropolitanensis]
MQVSDLTFRLKLLFIGFLSPLLVLIGLILSAPYWLKSTETYQKSDVAVLEVTDPLPSKKMLKAVVNLSVRSDFKKLILVIREDKTQNHLYSPGEKELKIREHLNSLGMGPGLVSSIIIPMTKMGDTDEASKNLLKIAVSDNVGAILLLTREYESKRVVGTYRKTLASLPIKVTVYGFPSEVSSSNWFLSEDGVREITGEFVRYLYSYIRGIL